MTEPQAAPLATQLGAGEVVQTQADLDRADANAVRRTDAAALVDRPLEKFTFTGEGIADRFAASWVRFLRLDDTGSRAHYWYVDEVQRWRRGGASEALTMARAVIRRMHDRADAMDVEAADGVTDERGDLVPDGDSLRTFTRSNQKRTPMLEMARLGCELHGMMVDAGKDYDNNRTLLALPDGRVIVMSRDRESPVSIRPLDPDDMVTMLTGVGWNPRWKTETPPEVTQYFETFMPDEVKQRMLQRVLGACLYGENIERMVVMLLGESTSGKSQLVEAIGKTLGDYSDTSNSSIFRGNLDDKPRPDIVKSLRRRVTMIDEADRGWEIHGDRFKAISGGGDLTARGMNSDVFQEVKPFFTPVINANHPPTIKGVDAGVRRRMLVFRFDQSLVTGGLGIVEDPEIKRRFVDSQDVREWLLVWLVNGYIASRWEGLEDVKDACALATGDAFDAMTHVPDFLESMISEERLVKDLTVAPYKCVGLRELHREYIDWVKNHGDEDDRRNRMKERKFNDTLRSLGWQDGDGRGKRWLGWQLASYMPVTMDHEGGER